MKTFKEFLNEAETLQEAAMIKGYIRAEDVGMKTHLTVEITFHGETAKLKMEALPNTMKSALVFTAIAGTELSAADYKNKTMIERELAKAETKPMRQAEGIINNLILGFNKPKVKKEDGVIFYTF